MINTIVSSNNSSPSSPLSPDNELESSSFLYVGSVDRMIDLDNNIVDLIQQIPLTPHRQIVTSPTKLNKHDSHEKDNENRASMILPNQRRKLLSSTVILSSQRIRSMNDLNESTSNISTPNIINIDNKKNKLSPSILSKISLAEEEKNLKRKRAALTIQRSWRSWKTISSHNNVISAVNTISNWRKQLIERRLKKFTQGGLWSLKMSDKMFGLLLGYRVRKIMKSTKVKSSLAAFKDIMKVLKDLVSSTAGLLDKDESKSCTNTIDELINVINNGVERRKFPLVLTADWVFIKSLLKQLNQQQQKVHRLVFEGSKWIPFPSPGFVSLSDAYKRLCISQNALVKGTPPRPSISNETPPRPTPQRREQNTFMTPPPPPPPIQHSERKTPNSLQSTPHRIPTSESPQIQRPRPLGEALDKKLLDFVETTNLEGSDIDPLFLKSSLSRVKALSISMNQQKHEQARSSSADDRPLGSSRMRRSQSLDTSAREIDVTLKPEPVSSSQRRSTKGHIQLDVLSADKLMPAKRGGGIGPLPDRKPGMKISLFQLVNNGNNSTEMKRIHQTEKQYEQTTLNPRWGSSFYLFLPCPKQIFQRFIDEIPDFLITIQDPMRKDEIYRRIRRELLDWWGAGSINITIVDGERFNDNVFLGETSLLLSSFLVPKAGKDHTSDLGGSFPLNKINASDKVSGSVKIHAYLHMPEDSYIFETIRSIISDQLVRTDSSPTVGDGKISPSQHNSPPENLENNEKKNSINVMQSPPREEGSKTRLLRLNDLNKTLDGLNTMQLNTDSMIKNMQLKLEEKKKKKEVLHDDVKVLKVLKRRSLQLMEDTDIVLGTGSNDSYDSELGEFNNF